MPLYISSQSTLKALGHIDTEAGLCIMARAALERVEGPGWGGGGGPRVALHRACVGGAGGEVVVADQPNYTWLIHSNRSGPK